MHNLQSAIHHPVQWTDLIGALSTSPIFSLSKFRISAQNKPQYSQLYFLQYLDLSFVVSQLGTQPWYDIKMIPLRQMLYFQKPEMELRTPFQHQQLELKALNDTTRFLEKQKQIKALPSIFWNLDSLFFLFFSIVADPLECCVSS